MMRPVVRVDEMAAIDAEAPEPVEVLIDRAGRALARVATDMLGGTYGRRVVVVAGPGNNGNDGRVAGERLAARGVKVEVVDATHPPARLPDTDLVVDAGFGTGCTRDVIAPDPGGALVLAVDIPSGIHGDTGVAMGSPMPADVTVTFAAAKPGLFLNDGPDFTGEIVVADIGLDVSRATIEYVDHAGVAALLPRRDAGAHKWRQAVLAIAGSPGMTGAATMLAGAAQRAGAGMVQLASPGVHPHHGPVEAVSVAVDESSWAETLLADHDRSHAVAIGPGLGTSMVTRHQVRLFVAGTPKPVVVDGDGLTALDGDAVDVLAGRAAPTVLTPHDGEFERLAGERPGDDRIAPAQELAIRTGATVLLKGPTTVVASPTGAIRLVAAGDERLATAGTGDVLTGIVAAFLAAGLDGFDAAAAGAHVHGTAASLGPAVGLVASDLLDRLPDALDEIAGVGVDR
ncbi:MAG: NAD(P)H-hydrate dehydratase [Acidimicrobiales bacterium]|nr:NAD(P)H-hydrate dehydratase [Acidimicrobiales bacterium]